MSQGKVGSPERDLIAAQPDRYGLADVSPQAIAPAFRLWRAGDGKHDRLRAVVRDRLIDLTARQARRQSPFYAERFAALDDTPLDALSLRDLPVLSRAEVEAAGDSIASRFADYAFSSYTSGTTRSEPLTIDRSLQEQRYISAFMSQLAPAAAKPDGVALILATWHHGPRLQLPGSTIGLPVYLANEVGFIQARRLLGRSYRVGGGERRIGAIAGTPNRLMQLTAYLAAEGLEEVAEPVRTLQTSGRYITRHARDWLRGFWTNASLVDRYSLTELFAGAAQCETCGSFHFDPYGHAEMVPAQGADQPHAARGQLLLTGLYPFTQMTPLIRYAPGDLVEASSGDCATGQPGYRFLGRTSQALALDRFVAPGAFLSAAEIYEALDPIEDVARVPNPPYPQEAPKSPVPGWCHAAGALPRFSTQPDAERPRLEVELRYSPAVFPDRVTDLETEIRNRLCQAAPSVADPIRQDRLTIELRPPSDLVDRGKTHRP